MRRKRSRANDEQAGTERKPPSQGDRTDKPPGRVAELHRSVGNQAVKEMAGSTAGRRPGRTTARNDSGSTDGPTVQRFASSARQTRASESADSATDTVEDAPPREVQRKRRGSGDVEVVDVRSPDSFRDGHVPGASNVPLSEISRRADEFQNSDEVVTCCRSGQRSKEAARKIAEQSGGPPVTNLAGGYEQYSREVGSGDRASDDAEGATRQAGDQVVQAKLTVSDPDDKQEREAERIADEVMRMDAPAGHAGSKARGQQTCGQCGEREVTRSTCSNCDEKLGVQRSPATCSKCEEERSIQRSCVACQREGGEGGDAGAQKAAGAVRSGGKALPDSARSFFEPRFGRDFSDVRVHTGAAADEAARSINAEAYTVGNDIAFRSDAYKPGTQEGKELLAHELTHVVQQNGAQRSVDAQIQRQPSFLDEKDKKRWNKYPDNHPLKGGDGKISGQIPCEEGDGLVTAPPGVGFLQTLEKQADKKGWDSAENPFGHPQTKITERKFSRKPLDLFTSCMTSCGLPGYKKMADKHWKDLDSQKGAKVAMNNFKTKLTSSGMKHSSMCLSALGSGMTKQCMEIGNHGECMDIAQEVQNVVSNMLENNSQWYKDTQLDACACEYWIPGRKPGDNAMKIYQAMPNT